VEWDARLTACTAERPERLDGIGTATSNVARRSDKLFIPAPLLVRSDLAMFRADAPRGFRTPDADAEVDIPSIGAVFGRSDAVLVLVLGLDLVLDLDLEGPGSISIPSVSILYCAFFSHIKPSMVCQKRP
jgi:hypothetical protein